MKKSISIVISILFTISIISCKKENKTVTEDNEKTVESIKKEEKIVTKDTLGFSKSGSSFTAFVKDTNYEIVENDIGFLNDDLLEDAVLLLQDKDDKTSDRIILVLLKQKDNTYKLISKNETIMGAEITADGYKINNEEDILIQNHNLDINLYCTGPCGNTDLSFSLNKKNELILTNYETFNMGAGSHLGISFDGKTAIVTTTNTMEEEMPTEQESFELNYKNSIHFTEIEINKLNDAILNKTNLEW